MLKETISVYAVAHKFHGRWIISAGEFVSCIEAKMVIDNIKKRHPDIKYKIVKRYVSEWRDINRGDDE